MSEICYINVVRGKNYLFIKFYDNIIPKELEDILDKLDDDSVLKENEFYRIKYNQFKDLGLSTKRFISLDDIPNVNIDEFVPVVDEWIRNNLFVTVYKTDYTDYYFQSDEDAMAFKLKWL